MTAKVWKLKKGRWGGITARGKRITIVSSKEKARKLAGLTSRSSSAKSKTKTERRKNPMAKNRRRRQTFTLPIAPMVGLASGIAWPAQLLLKGDIEGAVTSAKWNYLGIDKQNQFNIAGLQVGLLPLIIGLLIHKFVGGAPLNLNRILGRAGVPVLRI